MVKFPRGVIGMWAALVSFFAVGIPLYNRGVSFPLCFLAQLGLMTVLIFGWIFLVEKSHKNTEGKHGNNH